MQYQKLKWLKEGHYEEVENGINMFAPAKSDYFVNPLSDEAITNAPFLYQEVTGDFVFRANVSHDFISTYDACVLLALDHEKLWAKACFECNDIGTHSVVSVMTNQKSDDANSVLVEDKEIWLQIARKDQMFAVHYSYDGVFFQMARLTYLPMKQTIKVGFVAQSPLGNGGIRTFKDATLKSMTLHDFRNGNM